MTKDDSKLKSKDSIRQVLVLTYYYSIAVLTRFSAANLSDAVKFFAGSMSTLQTINLLSDHQTHYSGQLLVYFRLTGLTPPKYIGR